jgi:hypothetical protein
MKYQNQDHVERDRCLCFHSASALPGTGVVLGWKRRLTEWFRSLSRDIRQAGLLVSMLALPRKRRSLLIPVVATTQCLAVRRPEPRGHFLI